MLKMVSRKLLPSFQVVAPRETDKVHRVNAILIQSIQVLVIALDRYILITNYKRA